MDADPSRPTDPTPSADQRAAAHLDLATRPRPGECLLCFVARMLDAFGCDNTLRWVRRWRDLRLPRATGLEARLGRAGGFCDCEVFLNGWTVRPDRLPAAADEFDREDFDGEDVDEDDLPGPLAACAGVGPRSSQPCGRWVRRTRPW